MIATRTPEPNPGPYLSGRDGTLQAFVGKPWRALADGPDAFDCWALTRAAALALFGLDFPPAVYAAQDAHHAAPAAARYLAAHDWHERTTAAPGRVLALGGYDGAVHHVALCLDRSRALHTARALRSCVLPLRKLVAMYPAARFYEWAP